MYLLREDDVQTATSHLNLVEKKYPTSAAIQAMLGKIRLQSGDRTGAEKAFRNALKLLPDDPLVGGLGPYWKRETEKGLRELGVSEQ